MTILWAEVIVLALEGRHSSRGMYQEPSRAFWKGFADKPGREPAEVKVVDFFRQLLGTVYGEEADGAYGLQACGFRI